MCRVNLHHIQVGYKHNISRLYSGRAGSSNHRRTWLHKEHRIVWRGGHSEHGTCRYRRHTMCRSRVVFQKSSYVFFRHVAYAGGDCTYSQHWGPHSSHSSHIPSQISLSHTNLSVQPSTGGLARKIHTVHRSCKTRTPLYTNHLCILHK